MTEYATARANMVDGQIRPNRVTDPALIAAFTDVPRELFVPKAARGFAYIDEDLPIGGGRFLMEPMVFARLLAEAAIGPDDVVLDVGAATGYSTAVMARLAGMVVGLEPDPALAAQATRQLATLGADNALIVTGPLAAGHAQHAPYQAIILDGAVTRVPQALFDQLAEGGRLLAVVLPPGGVGQATMHRKVGGIVSDRPLFDAATRLLPGFEPQPAFTF